MVCKMKYISWFSMGIYNTVQSLYHTTIGMDCVISKYVIKGQFCKGVIFKQNTYGMIDTTIINYGDTIRGRIQDFLVSMYKGMGMGGSLC